MKTIFVFFCCLLMFLFLRRENKRLRTKMLTNGAINFYHLAKILTNGAIAHVCYKLIIMC